MRSLFLDYGSSSQVFASLFHLNAILMENLANFESPVTWVSLLMLGLVENNEAMTGDCGDSVYRRSKFARLGKHIQFCARANEISLFSC